MTVYIQLIFDICFFSFEYDSDVYLVVPTAHTLMSMQHFLDGRSINVNVCDVLESSIIQLGVWERWGWDEGQ